MGDLIPDRGPLTEFSSVLPAPTLPDGVLDEFWKWDSQDRLGFVRLPGDEGMLSLVLEEARTARGAASCMIAAGIGGSSLGLRALMSALGGAADRDVIVADSPDSSVLQAITRDCDPESTLLTAVTKSGGTAETLAIFMSLYGWLSSSLGSSADSRITAITDPVHGDLRRLAGQRDWRSLPVPSSVGGRFSVLSPVGLFPAAFAGLDVTELLAGAASVLADLRENGNSSLAAKVAAVFLRDFTRYPIHVFFPYSDGLFDTALWFAQLWGESLGKLKGLDGSTVMTGQTPLACRGPADQHSLVQLFMEGPLDKTVTFVTAGDSGDPEPLRGEFQEYPAMAYLLGRTPDELRAAEAEATASALAERGVPVSRFVLHGTDPRSLGELIFTLEAVTVLTGLALGIDPLDQPGVERGKILAYRAMGRPGY